MSVSNMKKLSLFACREDVPLLMRRLLRLRCVEIREEEPTEDSADTVRLNRQGDLSSKEAHVTEIGAALDELSRFATRPRSLIRPKERVDSERFLTDGSSQRAWDTVRNTTSIRERMTEIRNEGNHLRSACDAVRPYVSFDLPLSTTGTVSTDLILGVLPSATDLDTLGKSLYAAGAIAELLKEDESGKYMAAYCCKSDTDKVRSLLTDYGFLPATFKGTDRTAAAEFRHLQARLSAMEKESEELTERLRALSEELPLVEVLWDLESTELVSLGEQQKMRATEKTVMLTGWVPEHREEKLCELLDRFDCAYELSEPTEEDNPPILLKNNGFAANFEWVLGMYSYPAYGKFDPTFIMSIFYFIIFGIMFADAGYGLVLTLGCFLGVKLLKPSESMERFLKMFGYCGISCIVCGILFGAYFGDLPLAIMRNMMGIPEAELPNLALLGASAANVAVLFDPLQNPMGFLVVSLGIGAVHLIAGMAVKFVLLCRDGHVLDAIFDIGAYWLLFAGLGLLFLLPSVGLWVTVGAAALIVLTHGRSEKNPVMKVLKGLLGLYDLISYVSDLLSYSRILALGLAAGVIAQVVNILGTMGGPTPVGFIALVVAFVIGHLLNIAINVLGTFVHTSRLQYIEFFNKFYEDGGVPFEPALPSEKYTEE